ncbi:MAG: sulfite exporter TauE/SafE family protein [Dehalococcoidia bacterium]|nr:sulfite exporter TauE/SafE family protein [Chloroflexota bacterium]MCK4242695.1 sulfite exporter TauE/SafE family protein [Dehalococcoidia bacterium]
MSAEELVLGCFAVLVAAFTRSVTGFGSALVAAPLLLLVLEAKSVVVINIVLGIIMCLLILWQSRHHVRVRKITVMGIGSIFGVPIGAYIPSLVSASTLKLTIATLVVVFAILLALGHSRQFKRERTGFGISGFISGILTSSTSLGGPPVVLFLLNQGWDKEPFRASLAGYFLFSGMIALGALAFTGVMTTSMLGTAAALLPALLLGFYLGIKVLPRVDANLFRRIAISVVLVSGLVAIITAIVELF